MPPSWPSILEPGTPNLPGIAGLGAALEFLSSWEHGFLAARKEGLVRDLTDALRAVPGARVFGSPERYPQSGIVSFTLDRWSPGELGQLLREGFDVHVRTGLQCAPLIHDPLGAGPEGVVRVSLSAFSTETDISVLLDSLTQIQGARAA
jgi:selenocysteine lyase/cysteine desulfurase